MNLYCLSPPSPAMNFITELFSIENNIAKVSTMEAFAKKLTNPLTKVTAKFQISLAYVVPRFTNWETFACNCDCTPTAVLGLAKISSKAFLAAPGIRCEAVIISTMDLVLSTACILAMLLVITHNTLDN